MKEALIITVIFFFILSGLAAPFMYPTPLGEWWPWLTFAGSAAFIVCWLGSIINDYLYQRRKDKEKDLRLKIEREMEAARSLPPIPDLHRI